MGKSQISLSEVLLRDGALYFFALFCLNLACLIIDTTAEVGLNPIFVFIDSFSAILLCRLTLNLRMYTLADELHPTIASKRMSSVVFAHTFLDNIGASVSADEHYQNVEDSHDLKDLTTSTSNEVDNSPLATGLEHDIRRNVLVEALNKGTVIHSIAEEETENIELASV